MMAAISGGASRQFTATFTAPISDAAEEEVEVRDAVAVEEGDAVPDAEPVAPRRLRHTARGTSNSSPQRAPLAHRARASRASGCDLRQVPDQSRPPCSGPVR